MRLWIVSVETNEVQPLPVDDEHPIHISDGYGEDLAVISSRPRNGTIMRVTRRREPSGLRYYGIM